MNLTDLSAVYTSIRESVAEHFDRQAKLSRQVAQVVVDDGEGPDPDPTPIVEDEITAAVERLLALHKGG